MGIEELLISKGRRDSLVIRKFDFGSSRSWELKDAEGDGLGVDGVGLDTDGFGLEVDGVGLDVGGFGLEVDGGESESWVENEKVSDPCYT